MQWRGVADQIRAKVPKLAAIMDAAKTCVLAYMTFLKEHRTKVHSTNPIKRLNGEIKRRTDVVGIFPNEDAIAGLGVGKGDRVGPISRQHKRIETLVGTRDLSVHLRHCQRRR